MKDKANKKRRFHQATFRFIRFTCSHNLFIVIHEEPIQKNDSKYEKKLARNAQNASSVISDGFFSSRTRIVMIIARTASVKAINLSFPILAFSSCKYSNRFFLLT